MMVNWLIQMIELYGYISIFFLMALENLFPPIPSEVILLFGGFMTSYTSLTVLGVLLTASTGSIIGAIVLYGVGYVVHIDRLEIVVDKWGSFLRISRTELRKANDWFEKYGYWAVLICRMIPLVRSLISIPAGMMKMQFWLFLLFTMIGTFIWNTILVTLGVGLGASWQNILSILEVYSTIVYILIGVGFVILLFLYVKKR